MEEKKIKKEITKKDQIIDFIRFLVFFILIFGFAYLFKNGYIKI